MSSHEATTRLENPRGASRGAVAAAARVARALSPATLPRLPALCLTASRRAARAFAAWPPASVVDVPLLGRVSCGAPVLRGVLPAGAAPVEMAGLVVEGTVVRLEWEGRPCELRIDPILAAAAVDAVLDRAAPPVPRALSAGEAGVLAGIAAAALARAALPVRVVLDGGAPPLAGDRVALSFAIRTARASGRADLVLPLDALASPASPAAWPAWVGRHAAAALALEAARTRLSLADLAAARAGDAVVFSGAAAADTSLELAARFGAFVAAARLSGGYVRLATPFTPAPQQETRTMSTKPAETSDATPTASSDEARRIFAGATVEVVAEIGRISMTVDELAGFMAGGVLALGRRAPTVEMRVGDRPWASGELVNVDGELAVRITELQRP